MHGHKIVNQNHIHFITPTVVSWMDIFSRKIYRDIVIDNLEYCQANKGLNIHAYVTMSNHLHLVLSAKEGYNLSDVIRDFKGYTAKLIINQVLTNPKESRQEWMLRLMKYHAKFNSNNKIHQLWKRDNYPVELTSKKWIGRRVEYTHDNPVRAGIVEKQTDYLYSSARNYNNMTGLLDVELLDLE